MPATFCPFESAAGAVEGPDLFCADLPTARAWNISGWGAGRRSTIVAAALGCLDVHFFCLGGLRHRELQHSVLECRRNLRCVNFSRQVDRPIDLV